MMMMNFMLSLWFILIKHPLAMGAILLVQTTLVSLILGNLSLNFYYSYILFIVMVGGMMVLFLYMTSIASNEIFKKNWMIISVPLVITLSILIMFNEKAHLLINNEELSKLNHIDEFPTILNKFFNFPTSTVMMFLFIYLLLTLIAVVKITSLKLGPLRHMN
uniref:NADH-ubiquinone oxidoreductase chain 6 n=1 Tax=Tenebrionoidea sp. 19 KM-2017 TaxID=2219474 RepID=A0A346RJ01_9CUCU|nr:NADH dehydrogenase subunit 6 [Tenebrionoidea sp. 19 KM-2017]